MRGSEQKKGGDGETNFTVEVRRISKVRLEQKSIKRGDDGS